MIELHESEASFDKIIESLESGEKVHVIVEDEHVFTMNFLAWVAQLPREKLVKATTMTERDWIALQCAALSLSDLNVFISSGKAS